MYNTLNSAISDALKREGKVITAYSDNAPYNVIFRLNKDTNQSQNRLTTYYSVSENIAQGQLLRYNGKIYIVINQETPENSIYYKSDLLETNAVIYGYSNGNEIVLPTYSYDLSNGISGSSKTILEVNGELQMITVDNAGSRSLSINTVFNTMGANWKIQNLIFKNNIAYVYVNQTSDSAPQYSLLINNASDSYYVGDSTSLMAVAKYGVDTVNNATIQWNISDSSLAAIDSKGNLSFLSAGTVTITAYWAEHNLMATKTITIAQLEVTPTYKWYCIDDSSTRSYLTNGGDGTVQLQILQDTSWTFGVEKWVGTSIASPNDTYTFAIGGTVPPSNYTKTISANGYEIVIHNNAMYQNDKLSVTAQTTSGTAIPLTIKIMLGGEF